MNRDAVGVERSDVSLSLSGEIKVSHVHCDHYSLVVCCLVEKPTNPPRERATLDSRAGRLRNFTANHNLTCSFPYTSLSRAHKQGGVAHR